MPSVKLIRLPFDKVNSEFNQSEASFSDVVFGFLDGWTVSEDLESEEADEKEEENEIGGEENKSFWDDQRQILQATVCRTTSIETRIRNITKETIEKAEKIMDGSHCACGNFVACGVCRNCLMIEVSDSIRKAGFNCSVCKSKWKKSLDIPSGEHTFLDVLENTRTKSGENTITRVIIELDLRSEFEMAKASEEYNRLVRKLPEVFIGKVERLQKVIKILCSAAKQCLKERKMHMGPWRKQRYMQAKRLSGRIERTTPSVETLKMEKSGKFGKPKASMLTLYWA